MPRKKPNKLKANKAVFTDRDILEVARDIWAVARRGSPLDSEHNVAHLAASMTELRDAYAAQLTAVERQLSDSNRYVKKLSAAFKRAVSRCPACDAVNGTAHEKNCWFVAAGNGKRWSSSPPKALQLAEETKRFVENSLCECMDDYGEWKQRPCDRCMLISEWGGAVSNHPALKGNK